MPKLLFIFLQVSPLFLGRGSTNSGVAWYMALTMETKVLIHVASFEPTIRLLPERSTSAILVQTLAKRWWDTTYMTSITSS